MDQRHKRNVVKPKPAAKAAGNAHPALASRQPAPAAATPAKPVVAQPATQPVLQSVERLPAQADPVKARSQVSKLVGIHISTARVRRHLDKLNLNSRIDAMIAQYKEQLIEYKTAKEQLETNQIKKIVDVTTVKQVKGKQPVEVVKKTEEVHQLTDAERQAAQATVERIEPMLPELESKVAALSRERTRFSNEASIVLAIICDELIQQLFTHAFEKVLAAKKKTIQIAHLHASGIEKLSLYPLIKSLPSFTKMAAELAEQATQDKIEAAVKRAVAQAEKEFKKKYGVKVAKKPDTAAVVETTEQTPTAVDVVDDESEESEVGNDLKTSFKFYINKVYNSLKEGTQYKVVKISTTVRNYLSDLLIELIQRLSGLVSLTTANMKNKTVTDTAVLRTVEALMIDGHQAEETVELKEADVPDPAALKVELQKRDEEKRAGREYKIDMNAVPKIKGVVAVRTIKYPTSGYDELVAKVTEKMKLYAESAKDEQNAEQ